MKQKQELRCFVARGRRLQLCSLIRPPRYCGDAEAQHLFQYLALASAIVCVSLGLPSSLRRLTTLHEAKPLLSRTLLRLLNLLLLSTIPRLDDASAILHWIMPANRTRRQVPQPTTLLTLVIIAAFNLLSNVLQNDNIFVDINWVLVAYQYSDTSFPLYAARIILSTM